MSSVVYEVWNTLNLGNFSSGGLPHSLLTSYSCQFSQCWTPPHTGLHTRIWVALNFWNDYLYLLYKLIRIDWLLPLFHQLTYMLRWNFISLLIWIVRQLYLYIYSNSILTIYIFHFIDSMWLYINIMWIYRYTYLDTNLFQLSLKTEKLGRDW